MIIMLVEEKSIILTKVLLIFFGYINDDIKGKDIGSKCMKILKQFLLLKGINKLDADTAINNSMAQHYYLKNDFKKRRYY